MENFLWTLLFSVPLVPVFFFGPDNARRYICLGVLTLFFALLWEAFSVISGFWSYAASPQLFWRFGFHAFCLLPVDNPCLLFGKQGGKMAGVNFLAWNIYNAVGKNALAFRRVMNCWWRRCVLCLRVHFKNARPF